MGKEIISNDYLETVHIMQIKCFFTLCMQSLLSIFASRINFCKSSLPGNVAPFIPLSKEIDCVRQ